MKIVTACLFASASFLFGAVDQAFVTLLLCIGIDYIFGMAKALKAGNFVSMTGFWGIARKIGILFIIAIAVQLDAMMGDAGIIRLMAIYAYIGNEVVSILKNMTAIGVPIPDNVAKYFIDFAETQGTPTKKKA